MLGFDLLLTTTHERFKQQFIDLGKIGSGGFSTVHRVKSKLDGREYALKIVEIKPNKCKEEIAQVVHKFLEEVKVMSYLNHKNVVQYNGCWVESTLNSPHLSQQNIQNVEEQEDDEFQMVVDDMSAGFSSSGGIQFYNSKADDLSDAAENKVYHKSSEAEDSARAPGQIPKKNTIDQKIKQKYSSIKIYILCQLCEGNVQSFIYRRNKDRLVREKENELSLSESDEITENYKMILQIVEGLQYLHSRRIIHRDIKLHNIVFDSQKVCKIIDYGLSKKTRMLHSISDYEAQMPEGQDCDEVFSTSVGTRIYSSPEQISSEKYDHRTDIYSLAIVIVMFFCKFTTTHEELHTIQRIRKVNLDFVEMDSRLKDILKKCLGQQKHRPRLAEIRKVIKILLRQQYERDTNSSSSGFLQNNLKRNESIISKQQSFYIVSNNKLKKKISKEQYRSTSQLINSSLSGSQHVQIALNLEA